VSFTFQNSPKKKSVDASITQLFRLKKHNIYANYEAEFKSCIKFSKSLKWNLTLPLNEMSRNLEANQLSESLPPELANLTQIRRL